MKAVIVVGGKQYLVSKGQKLSVEKMNAAVGDTVSFDQVLLTTDGNNTMVGQPAVAGAKVTAKVLRQYAGAKVTVLKYKPKVRYRRKFGHRQSLTEIEVTKIAV